MIEVETLSQFRINSREVSGMSRDLRRSAYSSENDKAMASMLVEEKFSSEKNANLERTLEKVGRGEHEEQMMSRLGNLGYM